MRRRAARHLAERPPYVIDDVLRRRPRSSGKVNVGSGDGERGDDKLGRLCRLIIHPRMSVPISTDMTTSTTDCGGKIAPTSK